MINFTPNISYTAIKEIALEEAHLNLNIPAWAIKAVEWLESFNISLIYHTYKITTYSNPRDAVVVGQVLRMGNVGASLLNLPIDVKTVIYVKCVLDLFERYEKLYETCQNLNDAFYANYSMYQVTEWDLEEVFTTPSLSIWWETSGSIYQQQIIKICVCVAAVLVEIVKLAFFMRDLYLLTQDDPTITFYAYTDLASDLNNHCASMQSNLLLVTEQLSSQEALGNRLLRKMGMESDISTIINQIMQDHPNTITGIGNHLTGFKENIRVIVETGEPSFEIGKNRPRILEQCRFVPYRGQAKVDKHFYKMSHMTLV